MSRFFIKLSKKSLIHGLTAIIGLGGITLFVVSNGFNKLKVEHGMEATPHLIKHSHQLRATSKVNLPIQVSIQPEGELELSQPFNLSGVVQTRPGIQQIEIEWVIPEGVEVLSGSTHYTANLPVGSVQHVSELTVLTHSEFNQQIFFRAKSKNKDFSFSKVAQYNTLLQEDVDREIAEIKARNADYIEENAPESRLQHSSK